MIDVELELYRTVLILGAAVNLLIAVALLHNNVYYRIYDVYYRSRTLVALNYAIILLYLLFTDGIW